MQEITKKYYPDHRRQRCELIDELQKQPNRIFRHKNLTAKVTTDCRTSPAHEFRTKLEFKQYVTF